MAILFWLSVGMIAYVFLVYPIFLYILSRFRKIDTIPKENHIPSVSLLISAYNEGSVIRRKLENSLSLDYPQNKLEIVVASESTDETNKIAMEYFGQGVTLHSFREREGKAATLYRTVPLCKGEVIVFSDANAFYSKDSLRKLVAHFIDREVGCVSGVLRYANPENSAAGQGEGLYWKYEQLVKGLEGRLGTLLGANGSIFAIRKSLYFPLNYWRGDDFELPVMIALMGHRVVYEPGAISWEGAPTTFEEEYKRKVRIIAWNFVSCLYLLRRSARQGRALIFFQLLSHKLLRWLLPFWFMGLLVGNLFLTSDFYRSVLLGQLAWYSLSYVGGRLEGKEGKKFPLVNIPYYFCVANVASLEGLGRALFRGQQNLWEKVRA